MTKSHGFRVKTRKLMKKKVKEKRKGFTRKLLLLDKMKGGEKVIIKIDSGYHKGMPHSRYHGKVATVMGRRGRAFEVETTKGKKNISLTVRSEHLEIL